MELVIDSETKRTALIDSIKSQRLPFTARIKNGAKARSHSQNGYYWGVIIHEIADAMGEEDTQVVHKSLAKHLLGFDEITCREIDFDNGRAFKEVTERVPKSTATLTSSEFEEYLMKCRALAYQLFGLTLPLPNEVIYEA